MLFHFFQVLEDFTKHENQIPSLEKMCILITGSKNRSFFKIYIYISAIRRFVHQIDQAYAIRTGCADFWSWITYTHPWTIQVEFRGAQKEAKKLHLKTLLCILSKI